MNGVHRDSNPLETMHHQFAGSLPNHTKIRLVGVLRNGPDVPFWTGWPKRPNGQPFVAYATKSWSCRFLVRGLSMNRSLTRTYPHSSVSC